jgi:beta-lactamase regulating signal transducer with metallopeptidase domain
VTFGQTVEVYYDSQNPRMNALEDFSARSRKDERFVYILLLVLAVTGTFILWNEEPRGASPN